MGRRSSGPKAKKRKKVLVTAVQRTANGEPSEPYRLLAELIDQYRPDLSDAKIELLWRAGWRSDADGWVQMVNVKKAGDVDKALSVKADFAVLLNKERFPRLPGEKFKRVYLHHALCHMKPMYDADGEQKQDDQGRKLWRVAKRHDIEQFSEIVKTYGNDCLNLDEEAKAAIADADRPLLARAKQSETDAGKPADVWGDGSDDGDGSDGKAPTPPSAAEGNSQWRSWGIDRLELPDSVEEYIEAAGIRTLGEFTAHQQAKGDFWEKDLRANGKRKPPRFRQIIEDAFADFWREHPEFCGSGNSAA